MKFNVEKLKQMARPMSDKERLALEYREKNREELFLSETFALNVRYLLRREGISQTEFALRMGVSSAQACEILRGKRKLGLKTIRKIEHVLGQEIMYNEKMEERKHEVLSVKCC